MATHLDERVLDLPAEIRAEIFDYLLDGFLSVGGIRVTLSNGRDREILIHRGRPGYEVRFPGEMSRSRCESLLERKCAQHRKVLATKMSPALHSTFEAYCAHLRDASLSALNTSKAGAGEVWQILQNIASFAIIVDLLPCETTLVHASIPQHLFTEDAYSRPQTIFPVTFMLNCQCKGPAYYPMAMYGLGKRDVVAWWPRYMDQIVGKLTAPIEHGSHIPAIPELQSLFSNARFEILSVDQLRDPEAATQICLETYKICAPRPQVAAARPVVKEPEVQEAQQLGQVGGRAAEETERSLTAKLEAVKIHEPCGNNFASPL